ncbi:GIN domain-containing protein [Acinetobacter baumannii]|uniref:GIN domain-containing protein n=1 Tax=Acinetobacter baumannii TaxID=470 RepID=UPI001D17A48B|nr:DUF2807 domain-containing protein [Acinetobacter baumannii]
MNPVKTWRWRSADAYALPLKSNNLEVALSGSGNIFCTAINSAQVQLSGSGNVKVYGKPIHKSQNRTGSGNISFK